MLTYAYVMLTSYLTALKHEEGQGMAEYGLIIALVAIALITAFGFLQGGISNVFSEIVAAF